MKKYRKKPVVIEAIQWDGNNYDEIKKFATNSVLSWEKYLCRLRIKTLEGVMLAVLDDWIIKGIKGEFYPCKPDIFEATYEPVD